MKVDRRTTKHLSGGQINLIRKALAKQYDSDAWDRELAYQARKYGLMRETLREIVNYGHTEVTPRKG